MTSAIATPRWVTFPKMRIGADFRLFCFPYAGGGAHIFRTWQDSLPAAVEVCPIQLPGRGARLMEKPFTQMSPLVQSLTQALLPHLDKPFAFFGHSMGALISFELARQIRSQCGKEPTHLFVSGCFAPQIPDPHPIHDLPEDEFLMEVRNLNGAPYEVLENSELLNLMLPTLRADCMLTETYAYTTQPGLSCPISVFGGFNDPLIDRNHLEAWREQTSGSFSLHMFPGDHFFLHTAQTHVLRILHRKMHQLVSVTA